MAETLAQIESNFSHPAVPKTKVFHGHQLSTAHSLPLDPKSLVFIENFTFYNALRGIKCPRILFCVRDFYVCMYICMYVCMYAVAAGTQREMVLGIQKFVSEANEFLSETSWGYGAL